MLCINLCQLFLKAFILRSFVLQILFALIQSASKTNNFFPAALQICVCSKYQTTKLNSNFRRNLYTKMELTKYYLERVDCG